MSSRRRSRPKLRVAIAVTIQYLFSDSRAIVNVFSIFCLKLIPWIRDKELNFWGQIICKNLYHLSLYINQHSWNWTLQLVPVLKKCDLKIHTVLVTPGILNWSSRFQEQRSLKAGEVTAQEANNMSASTSRLQTGQFSAEKKAMASSQERQTVTSSGMFSHKEHSSHAQSNLTISSKNMSSKHSMLSAQVGCLYGFIKRYIKWFTLNKIFPAREIVKSLIYRFDIVLLYKLRGFVQQVKWTWKDFTPT